MPSAQRNRELKEEGQLTDALLGRGLHAGGHADAERRLLVADSVQGYEFDSAVVAKALSADAAEVEEQLASPDRLD